LYMVLNLTVKLGSCCSSILFKIVINLELIF